MWRGVGPAASRLIGTESAPPNNALAWLSIVSRGIALPSLGLLAEPDFRRLWAGLTVSLFGMQVSGLALPLAAIGLGATAEEMGLIRSLGWAPYLLSGLVAGAWLDRVPRRRVLVVTHLGRAALLASVPAAGALGLLTMIQLGAVAFALGTLMVFSDGAYQSVLPGLVGRERLIEGNSKLALSRSLARVVGPGLGGVVVQAITAPSAVAFDALGFAAGALLVGSIRAAEPAPTPRAQRGRLRDEVAEGVRWVFGHRLLRPIQLTSMTFILANSVWGAVYVLYATRELGIGPALLGLVFAAGGPGALAGSLAAGRLVERVGVGRLIVWTQTLSGAVTLLVPLTALLPNVAAWLMAASALVLGFTITVGSVAELSLRQAVTPARLQGRMNTTMRSLNWGTVTVGSLAGGYLGGALGLPWALAAGSVMSLGAVGWIAGSPVRRLRTIPVDLPA